MPLLTERFMRIALFTIAGLVVLTVAISLAGRWLGERIASGGNTDSTEIHRVVIGQDRLDIPANSIRLPEARRNGATERLDLYLSWPDLEGYSDTNAALFTSTDTPGRLIFLQLTQRTMSHDMSGRLDPIYRSLFEGEAVDFGGGLALNRFRQNSGYGGEVMLTASMSGAERYAVRCTLPAAGQPSTDADCQRDIDIGRDLSVLYRFSSTILPHWRALDIAVRDYIEGRMSP